MINELKVAGHKLTDEHKSKLLFVFNPKTSNKCTRSIMCIHYTKIDILRLKILSQKVTYLSLYLFRGK